MRRLNEVVLDRVAEAQEASRFQTGNRVDKLLLNLLLNATEVSPEGGRVALGVDWSPDEVNHLEFKVEDDGPGLDPSLGDQIFEPFWTTRSQGVGGLGLAICKRIVDDAHGSIEVTNRRNGGACFRVNLPIMS